MIDQFGLVDISDADGAFQPCTTCGVPMRGVMSTRINEEGVVTVLITVCLECKRGEWRW